MTALFSFTLRSVLQGGSFWYYIEAMTVKIGLTQGKIALVNEADFDLVSGYRWRYQARYGRRTDLGYAVTGKGLPMQKLIMGDPPKGMVIDHVNRNSLDNRRENLRFATPSQNAANAEYRGSTGYRGVRQLKNPKLKSNRFIASVWKDGKEYYLGCFKSAKEAAEAYDKKAIELFGEFATTNGRR